MEITPNKNNNNKVCTTNHTQQDDVVPDSVIKSYQSFLVKLEKRLPRATSGEVLSSRVKW
jgi:hypothetical protein